VRETDFVQVVEEMVAEELAAQLEPYKALLAGSTGRGPWSSRAGARAGRRAPRIEKLQAFLSGGRGGRGRRDGDAADRQPRRAPRRPPGAASSPATSSSTAGPRHVRRLRHTHRADGDVVVERVSDGKRVKRPPAKLVG
jgi:hypothetical protein